MPIYSQNGLSTTPLQNSPFWAFFRTAKWTNPARYKFASEIQKLVSFSQKPAFGVQKKTQIVCSVSAVYRFNDCALGGVLGMP